KVRSDLAALNKQLEKEIEQLDTAYNAMDEELNEVVIRPKTTDIHIPVIGLTWVPYQKTGDGRLRSAWD
ncbi:MAG: hypothetical protein MI865_03325, partial [Proteobacteria bacterium]|nr:hypothetical protein [Pseudomonadota bacterium]